MREKSGRTVRSRFVVFCAVALAWICLEGCRNPGSDPPSTMVTQSEAMKLAVEEFERLAMGSVSEYTITEQTSDDEDAWTFSFSPTKLEARYPGSDGYITVNKRTGEVTTLWGE